MAPGRGPVPGLVRRAGPGRPAAQRLVGDGHALGEAARLSGKPHDPGMDAVERADIERRGHRDVTALGHQQLGECDARRPVEEAAIDMGRGDLDEPLGAHQSRGLGDHAHRALRGRAVQPVHRRAFLRRERQHAPHA